MQTFLPYPDFTKSAQSLDYRRLGKQRVECSQIIKILDGTAPNARWRNHPAVKMWEGYLGALQNYTNIIITEWIIRGYNNTMSTYVLSEEPIKPWWFGDESFHRAMRARLIEKLPEFYLDKFGEQDKGFNDSKYFWPVNESKTFRII